MRGEKAVMNPEHDMETVQQQAERWFARLRSEGCSTAEHGEFDAWLTTDAAHASAYAQTERLWNELGELSDDAGLKRARHAARRAAQSSMRRTVGRRRMAIAASIVGALIVAISFWFLGDHSATQRYTTAHGEQRSVMLADGSRVMLNTDTVLDVTLGGRIRSVQLMQGEALFDVIHDASRPFVVHANGNVISDLGTRFDVNDGGRQTTVTVLDGLVNVERGNHAARLGRGQQLVAGDGIWREGTADPVVAASWSRGQLAFSATPLAQAIASANRYAQEQLVIADPRLDAIKVSGEFRIGNTQAFLRALESAFPIRVEQSGQTIRLYHR
jgi:transmembrane sensor